MKRYLDAIGNYQSLNHRYLLTEKANKSMSHEYIRMIEMLNMGRKFPEDYMAGVLVASGKTKTDLILDTLVSQEASTVSSRDSCDCGGLIVVSSSTPKGSDRHQYLKCKACGKRHGKQIVPDSQVFKRKKTFIPTIGKSDFNNSQHE